jgi:hypothetical protein
MKKILLGALLLVGCTDEHASRIALESSGYTDVRFTGYEFFVCADNDLYSTGFVARNPAGRPEVRGTVCCGILKGCTIRF